MITRASLFAVLLLAPPAVVPAVSAVSASAAAAAAHAPGQAYMFLRMHVDSMRVHLHLFVPHLERTLGLGWPSAGPPTPEQVTAELPRIRAYVESHFALAAGGARLEPVFRSASVRAAEPGEYVLLDYVVLRPPPERMDVTYTAFFEADDAHRNLVVIEHDWRTGTFNNEGVVSLVLSPGSATQPLDLSGASLWRGFVALVRLGVWHIWIGLDHILFLIALVLPAVLQRRDGRWQPAPSFRASLLKVVAIVTCFTLAHTVTLSLAALDVVHLPSRLVEAVIAGSIAAAALHNLWPSSRVNEPVIAFVFGLFHGFGFATVLGELGLGTEYTVLSLLGFNLGVEIGQVAIIVAIFPVLYLVRRLRLYPPLVRVGSAGLIAIGLLWMAERALDFNVPVVTLARGALARIATLAGAA